MTDLVGISFEGMDAFQASLDTLLKQAAEGARRSVNLAALRLASRTQAKLTTSSHKKGTPTPSRPGQPPSLVTGTLRRSVKTTPAVPLGASRWQAQVGPSAVYARIQELGGRAGRGGAVNLPARPYLAPSLTEMISSGELWAAFREGWGA